MPQIVSEGVDLSRSTSYVTVVAKRRVHEHRSKKRMKIHHFGHTLARLEYSTLIRRVKVHHFRFVCRYTQTLRVTKRVLELSCHQQVPDKLQNFQHQLREKCHQYDTDTYIYSLFFTVLSRCGVHRQFYSRYIQYGL
jgi:hypothetical protein